MSLRRLGLTGRAKAPRPRWIMAGSAGFVGGILLLAWAIHPGTTGSFAFLGGQSTGPSGLPPGASGGGQLSVGACAAEESNASLTQIIVHLYQGNGNTSGSGSGLSYQGPPGPNAYPSEAVAEQNVIDGWQSVCQSPAYSSLVNQWGAPNFPVNALAQNQTGVYEFVAAISWQAPNSSCSQTWGDGCTGSAEWLINVASGTVTGPTTSYTSPQPAI